MLLVSAVTGTNRGRLWSSLLVLVLAGYAWFGWRDAAVAMAQYEQSRENLDEYSSLLNRIARLKQRPRVASLAVEPPGALSARVSEALKLANIAPAALLEVEPGQPVRVEKSEYKIRATSIRLRDVTMVQTIAFCDALRDHETGSKVRDLVMREPDSRREKVRTETWNAEMVLTQTIYSPTRRE